MLPMQNRFNTSIQPNVLICKVVTDAVGYKEHMPRTVLCLIISFVGDCCVHRQNGHVSLPVQCCATLALVSQASNDDQLEEVRLSSTRVLAASWWHCLCEHRSEGLKGQTPAEQAQLVTAYWKVFLQCLFDSDPAVRETAQLCLFNVSQHFKVSEGIAEGKGMEFFFQYNC